MFAAHTIAKRFGSAMALYKDRVAHSEESVETDATFSPHRPTVGARPKRLKKNESTRSRSGGLQATPGHIDRHRRSSPRGQGTASARILEAATLARPRSLTASPRI
jgi:hypothetical protein